MNQTLDQHIEQLEKLIKIRNLNELREELKARKNK